jgi:hypothetical protein
VGQRLGQINFTEQGWFHRNCVGWELTFAWMPHRCSLTNKLIWLVFAYQGMSILTGPGDSIIDYQWHDKNEHLIWKLKGN